MNKYTCETLCSNYELCKYFKNIPNSITAFGSCSFFKDKSKNIELPCNIGDTVYMPWRWNNTEGIASLVVQCIVIVGNKPYIKTDFDTDDEDYRKAYHNGTFFFDDFGKTVFLYKSEAKQKLKE